VSDVHSENTSGIATTNSITKMAGESSNTGVSRV
jgi:hypothetical protein